MKEYESKSVGVRFISAGCCAEPVNRPRFKRRDTVERFYINSVFSVVSFLAILKKRKEAA